MITSDKCISSTICVNNWFLFYQSYRIFCKFAILKINSNTELCLAMVVMVGNYINHVDCIFINLNCVVINYFSLCIICLRNPFQGVRQSLYYILHALNLHAGDTTLHNKSWIFSLSDNNCSRLFASCLWQARNLNSYFLYVFSLKREGWSN